MKLLGAKLTKTTTQGSKARGSNFTAKRVFGAFGEATRVFPGKDGHEIGRSFTVILADEIGSRFLAVFREKQKH